MIAECHSNTTNKGICLDVALQLMLVFVRTHLNLASLPTFIKSVRVLASEFPAHFYASLRVQESKKNNRHKTIANVDLYDANSTLLARLEGCEVVSSETLSYVEEKESEETESEDPVVVVGMGVHYPGDASSVDKFWDTLLNGKICTKPIAKENLHRHDKVSNRMYGGLNTDEEEEDILLRVSQDALKGVSKFNPETCGIVSASLNFPRNDVKRKMKGLNEDNDEEKKPMPDAATYVAQHLKLGRERYCFDAACASGLYALKLASEALLHGDAETMLCGACTKPESYFVLHGFSTFRALASEGTSKCTSSEQDERNGTWRGMCCACAEATIESTSRQGHDLRCPSKCTR